MRTGQGSEEIEPYRLLTATETIRPVIQICVPNHGDFFPVLHELRWLERPTKISLHYGDSDTVIFVLFH